MPELALGWTKISPFILKSPEGRCVAYSEYRNKTGLCESCGEPMDSHPKCEACGLLSGQGHSVNCQRYAGHSICGFCCKAWRRLDTLMERKTTWEEFLRPEVFRILGVLADKNYLEKENEPGETRNPRVLSEPLTLRNPAKVSEPLTKRKPRKKSEP